MLAAISLPLPRCPVAAHLDLDCPGCGTTRALIDLAGGDIGAAVDHNVVAMLAMPVVLAALVWWLRPTWKPAWVARFAARPITPRLVLVVVVVFTVARNTPAFGGYLAST